MNVGQRWKILNSDYYETAKRDFRIYFENPNTRINLKLRWNHLEEEFERLGETLEDFFDELARNGLEGLCIESLDVETSDGDEIAQLMTWIDVNTITSLRINTNQLMLSDEDVEEFTETPQWQRIRNF
ncbi:unnamed protein product [Caenorhabditis nigoni]